MGKITSKHVTESSALGLADARRDLFFTLNDSGNPAEIWLIDRAGDTFGRWDVKDAKNTDWEELAVADDTLYVADTGDNAARRKEVFVYAFARPTVPEKLKPGEESLGTIRPTRTYTVRYENGPRDCEAVFVHDGRMYLLSKDRKLGDSVVSSFDLAAPDDGKAVIARRECVLPIRAPVTAASIDPIGKRLAVLTVAGPYLFDLPATIPQLATATPRLVIFPAIDSESICFVEGGLLTTRERGELTFFPIEAFGK